MHEYYRNNIPKIKRESAIYLRFVGEDLEQSTGRDYRAIWLEIWDINIKHITMFFYCF